MLMIIVMMFNDIHEAENYQKYFNIGTFMFIGT